MGLLDAAQESAIPGNLVQGAGLSTVQQNTVPMAAQAAPALSPAPSAPPAPPVTPSQQANDPVSNMLNFFRDPKRLSAAAAVAATMQDPNMMAWLKRGHEAQKENAGEALMKLAAGDKQGAIDMFNMNGDMAAESIEDGSKPGLYKVTMKGGVSREIDPKQELMTLLTPPQFFAQQNREDLLAQRDEFNKRLYESKSEGLAARRETEAAKLAQRQAEQDSRGAEREARIARDLAAAGLSTARANKVASGGGGNGVNEREAERTRRQRIGRVSSYVNGLKTVDPNTKEETGYDSKARLQIKALAERLINDDDMETGDAVDQARATYDSHVQRAKETVEKEVAKANEDASVNLTNPTTWGNVRKSPTYPGGAKNEKEFRAQRTEQLVKEGIAAERKGGSQASDASGPAAAAPGKPASPSPYKDGQLLTSKKDGKQYIVKNGVPVPYTGQ